MGLTKDLGALPRVLTVSGSNVGVGTTTPNAKLNVVTTTGKSTISIGDSAAGTYSQLLMYGGSGRFNWSLGAQYNVSDAFEITPSTVAGGTTFSTPALTVTSGGNVKIGTTTSTGSKLIVTGYTDFWSSTNTLLRVQHDGTRSTIQSYTGGATGILSLNSEGGNVGIGTTSPSNKLDVIGNVLVQGTQGFNATGETASIYIGDTASEIRAVYDGGLDFYQNSAHRMRIQGGTGYVGIGTTSPSSALHVAGTVTATALALAGNYNASVTTDSSWSSYQTVIAPGTLAAGVTYMITVRWTYGYPANNQPYYYNCAFLWVGASTNSTGTDNEFTPIGATHTGGHGATISFRTIAAMSSTSGIQARLNSFPTLGGSIQVKATRLE